MKKMLLSIGLILASVNAMACLEVKHNVKVCPGQTVFPDSYTNPKGGKVLAVNTHTKTLTVVSHHTGGVARFSPQQVSLRNACFQNICHGTTIFPDTFYHTDGATVLAVNPFSGAITIVAKTTGGVTRIKSGQFSVGSGCISGICVKDIVSPDDYTNPDGARVIAINRHTRKITVISKHTGGIGRYLPESLSVIDYCLEYSSRQRNGH